MSATTATPAQRAFLLAEAWCNRVFGEGVNPLYHLGTISYLLFWIVTISGIYLYAFFETSATHAYASVEAITHTQWFAGGLLRSAHRYASDALVVTMLLHLLRHFVFGRHRGYRWLSWITGLVLLGLTVVAGINGFMLPWDQLAQFVVTATTEMLNFFPAIGGALTRNFVANVAVTDRLFSLLAFIHIGVSLVILAFLWVHTQRTPAARTLPPRAVTLITLTLFLFLGLLRPVVSDAPANLSQMPAGVSLDWFYLAVMPLIHEGHVTLVWAGSAVAAVFLAVLPWLGRRSVARSFDVAVRPDDHIMSVRAGENLLDAGLREGLPMPYECRNGACGRCKCRIVEGQVLLKPSQPGALTESDALSGRVLLCCAEPLTDLLIEYVPDPDAHRMPTHRYAAVVTGMKTLTPDVMQLVLKVTEGGVPAYRAGQYINIILEDGAKRSFSFATAPEAAGDSGEFELHVRRIEGGRFTTFVFDGLKVGDRLEFEGPLGAFTLRDDSDKPIIFVAGSTGFAPVKSMLEHAFLKGLARQMLLYWGVRRPSDMYLLPQLEAWQQQHGNFRFIPIVSDPLPEDRWSGRTGLVHEAILDDFPDLSHHQVYACGSVGMVETATPAFLGRGISSDDCFSDAFHLSPHMPLASAGAQMVKLGGANA
ncbi:MAG: cytochrome b N-terminal domain-containing protein [Betaproteobacteria bacterium]|nr:cytochrome b N-terminal domain-containing protein [Betaproteobacteria bacterium]